MIDRAPQYDPSTMSAPGLKGKKEDLYQNTSRQNQGSLLVSSERVCWSGEISQAVDAA